MRINLAVGLQIGHDLTSALYRCTLSVWNSMWLMHWDNLVDPKSLK